jgi:UDP-N-acetylglucosamine:LPS N-acetylglucosamine transferase
MRVLILSAPVGAGHDAAAAALAEELDAAGVDAEIDDGLALLGIERLVVDGYRFQIFHAAWSWRLLYRCTRSRPLIRVFGTALARVASRRLAERIDAARPDVIVSAYPIVSAALAGLRRRGRLPIPCAALVTDFDPHPGWIHRDLDANLVVGDLGRATHQIRPPTRRCAPSTRTPQATRAELGINPHDRVILVVGGAWGVGNLEGAARAAGGVPGVHVIVVAGHNERLRRRLSSVAGGTDMTVVGFTERMPELMAASDVLIQNAAGLTCLEAFAAGVPVVMFDPLPGHGEDNCRLMVQAGLVARAGSQAALAGLLSDSDFWRTEAPALAGRSGRLFERQSAGTAVTRLRARPVSQPGRIRRVAPAAAVVAALGMWFVAENPPTGYDEDSGRAPAAHVRFAPPTAQQGVVVEPHQGSAAG